MWIRGGLASQKQKEPDTEACSALLLFRKDLGDVRRVAQILRQARDRQSLVRFVLNAVNSA
jgi:hypothetical protein